MSRFRQAAEKFYSFFLLSLHLLVRDDAIQYCVEQNRKREFRTNGNHLSENENENKSAGGDEEKKERNKNRTVQAIDFSQLPKA